MRSVFGLRQDKIQIESTCEADCSKNQETVGVQTLLNEWEEEADGEVGEPVDGAHHCKGSWPLGLLEELAGQDEGNATWPAAEGGDDGQNAHDTQVRDPGCVVL